MLSIRQTNLLLVLGCTGLIAAALYMEHVMKMQPCSLCITQRIFVIATGLFALAALIHHPTGSGRRVYAGLGVLAALLGAAFASRQLWLQSLPADQVPACGPGLAYIFEEFPFMEALKLLLQGDGNCAHVDKLFGLSLALWTLLAFIGLALINLYQALRRR